MDETQPLNLCEFVPHRISRLAARLDREFKALLQERFAASAADWEVLTLIGANPDLSSSVIADHTDMHRTKISRITATLEKRGWIGRAPDVRDRRSEKLTLTTAGRKTLDGLHALAAGYQAGLVPDGDQTAMARVMACLQLLESVASPSGLDAQKNA
jgi:DNA-binding MarR family transcriptional regulator